MKQTNSPEILVVGGCHVLGYPLGPSQGFPDQLASLLSESTSFASIGHLKLSHGRKVLDTVNRLRPEVLILQVGHFELTNGGSSYSTKKLSLERSSKSTHYPPKSRFQTRTGRFKWHLRCAIKALANIVLTRWKVDLLQLEAEFTSFLYEVAQCDCSRIIILSPLPCADPIFHHLRRQAGSCFKSVAAHYPEVEYLDVLKDPYLTQAGLEPFFDGTHLNAEGHLRLAHLLANQITTPFRAATIRERTLQ